MRTLKKTLCLILCLAMMVGLCAMGASAIKFDDYKDKDKITYDEAVTLLTALGVLEGDENGFRPQDGLTRAEAAAIMTRLLQKDIDKSAVSSFTDMAGYAWAQPYVKFCEDWGVIKGYGDGKFGPGDKLTTTQFALMLIRALGYDDAKEGFVDTPAWAINVTKKVTGLNLADGLAAYTPNQPITREEAAQLAFNTLFQTMVKSDAQSFLITAFNGGLEWNGGFVTVKDGAPLPNTSYDINSAIVADGVLQFVEAAFPKLKVKTDDDAFGIPTNYWFLGKDAQDRTFKTSKVIAETIAVPVLAVYDVGMAGVTERNVYDDACFDGVFGTYDIYENGQWAYDSVDVFGKGAGVNDPGYLSAYKGAQAILLDVSSVAEEWDEDVRLVVKYPYLAQVVSVKPGEDRSVALKIYQTPTEQPVANFETEDFKKGDFVLVYAWGEIALTQLYDGEDFEETIIAVKAADSLNGTLNRVDLIPALGTPTALTIAAEKHSIGSRFLANLGPVDGVSIPNTYKTDWPVGFGGTAFMNYGYVLGYVSDAATYGDYVLYYSHGDPYTNGFGVTTWPVGYVKQDGTALETKVKTLPDGNPAVKGPKDDGPYWTTVDVGAVTSTFAPFTKLDDKGNETGMKLRNDWGVLQRNDDGKCVLRHDTPELVYGTTSDSTYKIIADSKTNIILWTGRAFKAYVGIANVPDYVAKSDATDVYALALVPAKGTEDAHAVAVFIDVSKMVAVGAQEDPIYVLGLAPYAKKLDDETVVYCYLGISKGQLVELMTKSPMAALAKRGLVIPTYGGKYVVAVEEIDKTPDYLVLNADPEQCKFSNDTVKIQDTTYAVAKDAVAYAYNYNTGKLTTTTVEALSYLPAGEVTAIATYSDRTIKTIYYVYPYSSLS